MAIVLQPRFPIPDRSGQAPQTSRDFDGVVDVGWCDGVLSDGRAFRVEMWAQDQISMLTIFFSSLGMEGLDANAMLALVENEGLVAFREPDSRNCNPVPISDAAGNPIWSVNIKIGDEDASHLDRAVPIFPYSVRGEPNTMFNPVPIEAARGR
jgi:hypothetical protein